MAVAAPDKIASQDGVLSRNEGCQGVKGTFFLHVVSGSKILPGNPKHVCYRDSLGLIVLSPEGGCPTPPGSPWGESGPWHCDSLACA